MLPSINLLTAEFSGTFEEFSQNRPNPKGSGEGFAGLLNRPIAVAPPALPSSDAGQLLPPGGKGLPEDLDSLPLLQIELPVAEFFEIGIEGPELAGSSQLAAESVPSSDTGQLPSGLAPNLLAGQFPGELAERPESAQLGADLTQSAAPEIEPAINPLADSVAKPLSDVAPLDGDLLAAVQTIKLEPAADASRAQLNWSGPVPWPVPGKSANQQGAGSNSDRPPDLIPQGSARIADSAATGLPMGLALRSAPPLSAIAIPASDSPVRSSDQAASFVAQRGDFQAVPAAPAASNSSSLQPTQATQDFALAMEAGKVVAAIVKPLEGRSGGGSASPSTPVAPVAPVAVAALHAPVGSPAPVPPAASIPPAFIGAPLQDPAWSSALGERVLFMTGQNLQSAEIRIVPRELGPITVNLVVEDGAAELTFSAQHAVTREAIELAIPRLREMLGDSGLSLGSATVTEQGVQKDSQGTGADKSSDHNSNSVDGDTPAPDQSASINSQRVIQGLIDTFV